MFGRVIIDNSPGRRKMFRLTEFVYKEKNEFFFFFSYQIRFISRKLCRRIRDFIDQLIIISEKNISKITR